MVDINTQVARTWTNPYHSQMQLTISNGIIQGTYASTAGATGVYKVFGWIDPATKSVDASSPGAPVSLMINWRSIQKGNKPDPSWNFVSGMSGELICDGSGNLTMQLNHALIVTNDDGPITPGFYVDRLQYTPAHTSYQAIPIEQPPAAPMPSDDLTGAMAWVSEQDPGIKLSMDYPTNKELFLGAFYQDGQKYLMLGTANTDYKSSIGPYQGVGFCVMTPQGHAMSLSGWVDTTDNSMMLQQYQTSPQVWKGRFFQSTGRTLYMKPGLG